MQLYTKQFRQFIVEIDSTDAASLHLIGIPEGMSNKPITPEQIPIFEDKLTFRDSFNSALSGYVVARFYLPVCFFQEHVSVSYAQKYEPVIGQFLPPSWEPIADASLGIPSYSQRYKILFTNLSPTHPESRI